MEDKQSSKTYKLKGKDSMVLKIAIMKIKLN